MQHNFIDYTGKTIGMITVIKRIKDRRIHTTTYLVKCECGSEHDVEISNLRKGKYEKCRCGFKKHPLKGLLQRIIERCENPKCKSFKWYGKKGISICEEWKKYPIKFIEWSLKNGWEKGLTIDRIDNNKDYEPSNCRWIKREENSRKAAQERWKMNHSELFLLKNKMNISTKLNLIAI